MKSIKYILTLIVFSLVLNSCEYDIDYKGELPGDKLVVASFIQADSIISISITKSAKPGTYNYDMWSGEYDPNTQQLSSNVNDAKAELFINGNLQETLNGGTEQNKYTFTVIPRNNDSVEVRISYKDFKPAVGSANLNLLKPVSGLDSILVQKAIDTIDDRVLYQVVLYLEIIDNGRDNYYQIEPDIYYEDNYGKRKLSLNEAELLSENILGVYKEASTSFQSSSNHFGVISNKLFKGKTYKVRLAIPIDSRGLYETPQATRKVYGNLNLSAIDKKSYNYLFTLNRYYNNYSFMSEPVIIVDGIENAYGFIGAKNTMIAHSINFIFGDNDK